MASSPGGGISTRTFGPGIGSRPGSTRSKPVGFKLEDVLAHPLPAIPVDRCPTGKTVYATKALAREKMKTINHHIKGRPMQAYRCGYCEKYHLGHKRGVIL